MSRVFTIVVILLLMAVVALVPRNGTEEQGPYLGDGHSYREETLTRFRLLLEDPGWSLADPPQNPQGMLEAVHEKTGLVFVLIPAGSYLMGAPKDEDKWSGGEDLHPVAIRDSFLLCATECTQAGYDRIGGNDEREWEDSALPIEGVNWVDVKSWCEEAGLRLPSEAEWEFACRAGTKTPYSWGDEWDPSRCLAENDEGSIRQNGVEYYRGRNLPIDATAPARQFSANPWGLYDMHGNVREWCEDTFHRSYEGAPPDGAAWTVGGELFNVGPGRVIRGGAWNCSASDCRSAARSWTCHLDRDSYIGFRPAADLPK